ncbi:hypothetical protein [Salipaludibacillus keqinensis]|nr:hypothetical protein [Salipaludibacillus keqinensis]
MKKAIVSLIIMIGLIYGGYQFILGYASDQLVGQVANEVFTDDAMHQLLDDPQVASLIESYQSDKSLSTAEVSRESLPFKTKEEATKLVVSKFSITEIREISSKASRGLSKEEQLDLETKVMERLTPEEIEALMIIGLSEINF